MRRRRWEPESDRPATVATSLRAGVDVHVQCRNCRRWRKLDLQALAARGHAETPLLFLPLVCSACGSRDHDSVVSPGEHPYKQAECNG